MKAWTIKLYKAKVVMISSRPMVALTRSTGAGETTKSMVVQERTISMVKEGTTRSTEAMITMPLKVYSLEDLEQFSSSALNQRVVGSSSEHEASSRWSSSLECFFYWIRSHAVLKMEVMDLELWEAREKAEEVILVAMEMI